jgi:hypothetical protein
MRANGVRSTRALAERGQNLIIVFAEPRRRRVNTRTAMSEGESGDRHREFAADICA